jgi:hypothetical protein
MKNKVNAIYLVKIGLVVSEINSEKIWKIQKKIVKRYGKYGRKASRIVIRYKKYGRKES